MRDEFISAVNTHQEAFGLALSEAVVDRLADYYELVQEHNPLLHLVGPCSAEEFALRHILESLTLLDYLPQKVKFADIGPGGGLPSIPCLLARDDLRAMLIESTIKKSKFLQTAVHTLALTSRAHVVNRQFEEADPAGCEYITCRALDKFTEKLPRLIKWAKRRSLLLFGGLKLGEALRELEVTADPRLLPLSEQRFLFVVRTTAKK